MDVGRQGKKTLTSQIVRLLENIHSKFYPRFPFFVIATKQRTPYYLLCPCFHILKSPLLLKIRNIAGGRQGQQKKLPPNSKMNTTTSNFGQEECSSFCFINFRCSLPNEQVFLWGILIVMMDGKKAQGFGGGGGGEPPLANTRKN